MRPEPRTSGEQLLSAVERLVDDPDLLIAEVESFKDDVGWHRRVREDRPLPRQLVAVRIIRGYSNKSALAGAITALPSMLPGGGTVVSLVGGSLVDMTLMLKHEVEMALCLTYLYGFDIREERGRWLAFTLAAVNTYDVASGRNFFVDAAEAQLEALSKYTPRQLSKLALTALGKYALIAGSRRFVRVIPFVGLAVSASANKLIVGSVGWRSVDALDRLRKAEADDSGSVIDARMT